MSTFVLRFLALLLVGMGTASADSWMPPKVQTYASPDGRTRVVVTPRPLDGALPFFEDKVAGKEPAGQQTGNPQLHPTATLQRRTGRDWETSWTVPLVNDVAPVETLLANEGRYLVTFDNWHSVGHGVDAIVIYGRDGALIRKLALADVLSSDHIALLSRSVSSLYWSGTHALSRDGETLIVRVIEPVEESDFTDDPKTAPIRVRLSDGFIFPKEGREWVRTQAAIDALTAKRFTRWQLARAVRASPLRAPADREDEDAWRAYAVELRERLNDATGQRHAGNLVPKDQLASDGGAGTDMFELVLGDFGDAQSGMGDHFMFVAQDSRLLADALSRFLAAKERGSLTGATIAIVGTPGQKAARLRDAATHVGAKIMLVDESVPYPAGSLPEAVPEWFQ